MLAWTRLMVVVVVRIGKTLDKVIRICQWVGWEYEKKSEG